MQVYPAQPDNPFLKKQIGEKVLGGAEKQGSRHCFPLLTTSPHWSSTFLKSFAVLRDMEDCSWVLTIDVNILFLVGSIGRTWKIKGAHWHIHWTSLVLDQIQRNELTESPGRYHLHRDRKQDSIDQSNQEFPQSCQPKYFEKILS